MDINHAEYTIAEMVDQFQSKQLVINRNYQRGGGLWPDSAKSYFIDTVLEKYPFPKLYFYQTYDRAKKRPVMEVVDGQQRLLTIVEFVSGKLRISKNTGKYAGCVFDDLGEQEQESFLMYRVPVDVILAAQRPELLEMFRRMNAYTAPLNAAEKRHSRYQGRFKWFAVELSDRIGPTLEEWGILTTKQILRMGDAELVSDLALVLDEGLTTKSTKSMDGIYSKYESEFPKEEEYYAVISDFFDLLVDSFGKLRGTLLVKPYAIHSLFSAYAHIKWGIPNGEEMLGIPTRGKDVLHDDATVEKLLEISDAHELKDKNGVHGKYVSAALDTTTKVAQRIDRTQALVEILDPK